MLSSMAWWKSPCPSRTLMPESVTVLVAPGPEVTTTTPGLPVARRAVLSAASTASKPELQKIVLPLVAVGSPATLDFRLSTLDFLCHRSNVIRLNSRASCAFSACG